MVTGLSLLLRVLPLLLWGCQDAQPTPRGHPELHQEAEAFLEKYGYLSEQGSKVPASTQFSDAIREFQWVSQLPISGVLDRATLRQMTRPRCGVADTDSHETWTERIRALLAGHRAKMRRKKRFAKPGHKWYKQHLSYRLVNWPKSLPEPAVRGAVRAAFQLWSNVSALEFWEAPATGPADIRLTFFQGDHNDGLANAFDGPGGALAHAFLPRRGEAHFDQDERWSLSRRRGRNLFVVLAHEIGHTLGLTHSPAPRALMAPYYKKLGRDALLSWDDVLAVQNLYGKPLGRSVATQLPGKIFTDFEAWDPHNSQSRRPETRGPKYCHSSFDAITVDGQWRLYVFKGSHFWEVTADGNVSEPHPLQKRWPGLPSSIEAAAVSLEDGDFFFFKGNRCWRFQGTKSVFAQLCRAGGLPRHPDAALFFPPLRRLVLFKGSRYYVLARGGMQVEPYYPRSLRDWAGVPEEVSGALPRPDGSIIFFRDDHYWHLDQAKLRVTSSGRWATELSWMGCWNANSGGALFQRLPVTE
ncbi:matrix metalloproteinase-28 precursor [Rattus norvegicus]|uniref:Matrix metallopeptidase 28 n=2 Tax=Rattus norvegicus TaxID=10116 RepID=A1EC81_RAT|nr:matrix metalloproteinase-28 precursor [Rattus norvegicus]ABL63427.1 matrix metalloproteinase 28 [Rattus norvegicus]|eukprot:NP_001073357.1 matrix metalloproteinase-28 precursor [Rattus norvegicus]